MTHCRNGSPTTAAGSRAPSASETLSTSSGAVAGTIRSTIVDGNVTRSSIKRVSSADRKAANLSIAAPSRAPLDGTLSQLISVSGGFRSLPPPIERKREQAKERARREAAFKVRAKRRIVEIERARRRRQAIAFFGHGDRRDGNLRPAERGDSGLGARLVRNVDHLPQRADDAGLGASVLPQRAGIETVLRDKEIGEARRREVHAEHPPSSEASLEHVIDEFGLVTAMKSADANMRHADLQALAIILRLAHRWRQLRQKAAMKASHRLKPQSSPPKTFCV